MADTAGLLPETNEQHDNLVHKSMLMAAWVQVLGGALAGMVAMAIALKLLRRRRAKA